MGSDQTKEIVKGIVVPHAGYRYSGYVAGAVFSRIVIPRRVLLLCPNHTGLGESLSIMSQGEWDIPFGTVRIDTELAEKLICQILWGYFFSEKPKKFALIIKLLLYFNIYFSAFTFVAE